MKILDFLITVLLPTTLMTVVIEGMKRAGWSKVDWIRNLGRMISNSDKHSFGLGLAAQYLFGLVFTLFYALLIPVTHANSTSEAVKFLSFIGACHGFAANILLTRWNENPKDDSPFITQGYGTFVSVILGHVAFGFTLGLLLGPSALPYSGINETLWIPLEQILGFAALSGLLLGPPAIVLTLIIIPWIRPLAEQLGFRSTPVQNPVGRAEKGRHEEEPFVEPPLKKAS